MPDRDWLSIVICGEAGQGIQTIEAFLTRLFKTAGFFVFSTKEYMSRIRGGSNSTEIRVSHQRVAAYSEQIDILIPLDPGAISHLKKRITEDTILFGEIEKIHPPDGMSFFDVPLGEMAKAIGHPIFANIAACGVIAGLFAMSPELLTDSLRQYFIAKPEEIIEKNIVAAEAGYQYGVQLRDAQKFEGIRQNGSSMADDIIINGTEAVALGALAGGCNFIASYPMSPGTGVLTYLAQLSQDMPIIVEQVEDEIAAINMALGAWYAGARAMVTTSGGGFALMTEGISLAGMIESPIVVHLAQRPGPATGLPTRTEQADLELALYAGHGEFPRIILAPGNQNEAFYLTQKAFQLADRFQVPVFILTDQFLVDSYSTVPCFDLKELAFEEYIVETTPEYRRYEWTDNGISPRGIPGYGSGLVGVDSDEHDEVGHITEDLDIRVRMNQKRLRKLEAIKEAMIPPELIGSLEHEVLVIGWGSTYEAVKEAVHRLNRNDLSFLHLKQVYPLPLEVGDYLKRAKQVIIVEGNAGSQLGHVIQLSTGIRIEQRILKFDGMPFSVEELMKRLQEMLEEGQEHAS